MKTTSLLTILLLFTFNSFAQSPAQWIQTYANYEFNGVTHTSPKVTGPGGRRSLLTYPFEIDSKQYEFSLDSTSSLEGKQLRYKLTISVTEEKVPVLSFSSEGVTLPSEPIKYSFSCGSNKASSTVFFSIVQKP